jgi:hypothetical protein
LGFPLTESTKVEYQSCDLRTQTGAPARQILIISRENDVSCNGLAEHLKTVGVEVSHANLQHPRIWEKSTDPDSKGLVPVDVLEQVGVWMSEVFP